MTREEFIKREDEIDKLSRIRLKGFKEAYNYDLEGLIELNDKYCLVFDPEALRKEIKVSLRKAMLVTFESRMMLETRLGIRRESYSYNSIKSGAKTEFRIGNKDLRKYPNLEAIHPSDPNVYFEDNPNFKNSQQALVYYKTTLLQILASRSWMLQDSPDHLIFNSLKFIFDDI